MKIKKTGWASVLLVASSLVALNASALTRNLDYDDDDNGILTPNPVDFGSFDNTFDQGSGSFEDFYTFQVDATIAVDFSVAADDINDPNNSFNIDNLTLEVYSGDINNNGTWALLDSDTGDDVQIANLALAAGTDYFVRITGDVVGKPGHYSGNYVAAVPVPAAVWLFGSALAGLAVVRRRKVAAA